jgi:uncharacterized membrane protein YhhN
MQYDLGVIGAALLLVIALIFGAVAHLVLRANTSWMWLIGTVGWFVGGLVASEVIWGSMTEGEIQPIIDGLALDESLLGGLILGLVVVVLTRLVAGPREAERPTTS